MICWHLPASIWTLYNKLQAPTSDSVNPNKSNLRLIFLLLLLFFLLFFFLLLFLLLPLLFLLLLLPESKEDRQMKEDWFIYLQGCKGRIELTASSLFSLSSLSSFSSSPPWKKTGNTSHSYLTILCTYYRCYITSNTHTVMYDLFSRTASVKRKSNYGCCVLNLVCFHVCVCVRLTRPRCCCCCWR